jgi:hypothetical protein
MTDEQDWERRVAVVTSQASFHGPEDIGFAITELYRQYANPWEADGWDYDGDRWRMALELLESNRVSFRQVGVVRKSYIMDRVEFPLRRRRGWQPRNSTLSAQELFAMQFLDSERFQRELARVPESTLHQLQEMAVSAKAEMAATQERARAEHERRADATWGRAYDLVKAEDREAALRVLDAYFVPGAPPDDDPDSIANLFSLKQHCLIDLGRSAEAWVCAEEEWARFCSSPSGAARERAAADLLASASGRSIAGDYLGALGSASAVRQLAQLEVGASWTKTLLESLEAEFKAAKEIGQATDDLREPVLLLTERVKSSLSILPTPDQLDLLGGAGQLLGRYDEHAATQLHEVVVSFGRPWGKHRPGTMVWLAYHNLTRAIKAVDQADAPRFMADARSWFRVYGSQRDLDSLQWTVDNLGVDPDQRSDSASVDVNVAASDVRSVLDGVARMRAAVGELRGSQANGIDPEATIRAMRTLGHGGSGAVSESLPREVLLEKARGIRRDADLCGPLLSYSPGIGPRLATPCICVRVGTYDDLCLPAIAPLDEGHLVVEGDAELSRPIVQTVALRLLLGNLPGTIRATFIDPAGSGQGFAMFRGLPTAIRGERVLTQAAEIDARVAALVDEAEEVIQQRLAGQYDTIDAYNQAHPAVAQPHRLIAILGFPSDEWTDRARAMLFRLARNGPRAGFHILLGLGGDPPPEDAVDDSAFRGSARVTKQSTGATTFRLGVEPEASFVPDVLPSEAWAAEQIRVAADEADAAPQILPAAHPVLVPPDWSGDSTEGVFVPLGVSSDGTAAEFGLGRGTVHNALMGGMVGSGKTNALRLIVDQITSHYSPAEIALYLLDFKSGVGFADYVQLPHARAVALDTDREFGLSVIRHVRSEIETRGQVFRSGGFEHYAQFRAGGGSLPRLLLVMDEFQVMFAEDDALAREAAASLEDIVRRGRAFGIHVLLASQTPAVAGAYLTRMLEQMGLRIAFKCPAQTSAAILGEANLAAAKLEQPGDAIVNDSLGAASANCRVRVHLLEPDEHRSRVSLLAAMDAGVHSRPATFEGAAPAVLATNTRLNELRSGTWQPDAGTVEAFLGEPLELKGPTSARFERYPRSNLLVVGPEESEAYGLLIAAVTSLALQEPDARFDVSEFARPGSPVAGAFAGLSRHLGGRLALHGPRDVTALLDAQLADLAGRIDGSLPDAETRYFVVCGVHRWRELRGTDPYSAAPEAAGLLRLLDEGPDHGIHVIAWSDGHASLERALKRTGLGFFDMRAVLRVPESDSQNLLESTAAARLPDNRALFRHEEWPLGQLEKFKPYRLPEPEALAAIFQEK